MEVYPIFHSQLYHGSFDISSIVIDGILISILESFNIISTQKLVLMLFCLLYPDSLVWLNLGRSHAVQHIIRRPSLGQSRSGLFTKVILRHLIDRKSVV